MARGFNYQGRTRFREWDSKLLLECWSPGVEQRSHLRLQPLSLSGMDPTAIKRANPRGFQPRMNTDRHRFNRRKQRERRGGKGKIMGRIADLRFEISNVPKLNNLRRLRKILCTVIRIDTDRKGALKR